MLSQFKQLCGDLGGYESDFLYICSFITFFDVPLKSPQWSFVGLRTALNSYEYDPVLRDIMRRCFLLAGRAVIGGNEDANDSRMDRAIARLAADRDLEASILFPDLPDFSTSGFLSHTTDMRARIVRFIMQNVFENPIPLLAPAESLLVGMDSLDRKYYLLKDSGLDIGCWREDFSSSGGVELVATDTAALMNLELSLRPNLTELPDRTKNMCVYCRKKGTTDLISCVGCQVGVSHLSCLQDRRLWACSKVCQDLSLANRLNSFLAMIEPLQKAAMRKRRRMAHEMSSLGVDASSKRVSRSGRVSGTVDYSFREFDEAISNAIRKSEKNDFSYQAVEQVPTRTLSREERMALRMQRDHSDMYQTDMHGDMSAVPTDTQYQETCQDHINVQAVPQEMSNDTLSDHNDTIC